MKLFIREQDVPRKRLWGDCTGLYAAEKTSKPSKSQKIQSLLDEIINDSSIKEQSISQGSSNMKKMAVLPIPPPELVAEEFPDEALPKPKSEVVAAVFQEKEHPGESTPRTYGDIIGFSDTED